MSDPTLKVLMQLRDVWARTGVLVPMQVHQLQMWTMCVLPKTKNGEVIIDQDNQEITFVLKPEFFASLLGVPKEAPLRCAYLERWVHQLLDGRVLVRVYWAKTLIYTGTRVEVSTPDFVDLGERDISKIPGETTWRPNPKIKY